MKNWKYIEGAKTGNGILDILKSEKPIKMKSSKGEIVTIHPDGSAAHQDKEGSQMAVHHYKSFKEAVEYYKNQGYTKTGNDTPWEYAHRKPKVINEEKTGAEEFFKKLSDDVKEREKKDDADIEKVGNSLIGKTVWVKKSDGHQYKATVLREDGGRVYVNTGDGDQFWRLKHEIEVINKVGNFKTGTSQLKPGDRVQSYGVQGTVRKVEGENSDNIYGEPIIEVEWDNGTVKKVGEHYLRKIGNKKLKFTDKKDGLKEFVYDEENDKGYIYYDGKLVDTIPHAGQGWINLIKQKAFSSGVMNKIGNSAQDDKFAYVMREFDEGKLKTPDGKVVTDPAQAKAIAYSESKKTENGLARARNAMNKGITMWKGNDSAYIKEDGTVSYLENNSFETDKDKFESQESAIKELSKQGYVKK